MFKRLQGFIIGVMFCLLMGGAVFAAELNIVPNPFPVFFNGEKVDVAGYNINGSTFLKLIDFQKLGLQVSFNSEKKQIEVGEGTQTAVGTNPAPESIPAGEENSVNDTQTITQAPDGLRVQYRTNEMGYYVAIDDIYNKYKEKGYSIVIDNKDSIQYADSLTFNLLKDEKIILENAPRSTWWIEYNYYVNTVLPLLQ